MTEYERVREEIKRKIIRAKASVISKDELTDQILSLDGIGVKSDDQSLPEGRYKDQAVWAFRIIAKAQGFIRVIPKPKRK